MKRHPETLAQKVARLREVGLALETFGLGGQDRRARMRRAAEIVLAEWSAEARSALNSTLPAYLRSLAIREVTEDRAVVALPGDDAPPQVALLARIVEFGMGPAGVGSEGPYDVRQYLLRASTRNVRWGKTGPYVNVPFGLKAQEIEALGGSSALRAAQRLGGTTTDHRNRRTVWGGRIPPGMARKMRPHHASDPLAGVVRRTSTYSQDGGEQTSGFMKWRRASLNASRADAWRSSGVKARRLAEKVSKNLPNLLKDVL